MKTQWIASVCLITPSPLRAAAAIIASSTSGRSEDSSPEFFSVPLYPLEGSSEDPSHYLAHTRVRKDVLERLEGLSQALPGSAWTVTEHEDPSVVCEGIEVFLGRMGLGYQVEGEG